MVMFNATWRYVYVIVGGWGSVAAPYTLTWSYADATPSPTMHWSPTASRTATASAAETLGASLSHTPTPTRTAPATGTHTGTHTGTPAVTPTPGTTPSHTASPGSCGSEVYITAHGAGRTGAAFGTTAGQQALFPYGHCANQPTGDGWFDGTQAVLLPAAMVLVEVDLSAGGTLPTPVLNGTLEMDTCQGTDYDSLLWLGTSCPTGRNFANMDCLVINDDVRAAARRKGAAGRQGARRTRPTLHPAPHPTQRPQPRH